MAHGGAVLEHGLDPLAFEAVRQLAEHREDVAEPVGERGIDVVLHGAGVAQAENMDLVARLSDALDAALALFEAGRVPWPGRGGPGRGPPRGWAPRSPLPGATQPALPRP